MSAITPVSPDVSQPHADDTELLRAYLTGREVPCPQCGYNLRDLTGNRCPECGEELTLRLQLSEPKQAAALAGLIALSAGAGMNALLLGYAFIINVFYKMNGFGLDRFIVINSVGLLALGSLIASWLRYWRYIRRLGVIRRWVLVAACAALSLADLVIFAKVIR
jgi:predicted RNA-binding Zn-ribbon protein involved in translation (DUF1610 family)